MNTDLYSGAIDWDKIYRTFHSPYQIAKRVREELGGTTTHVIFSGFMETASYLAKEMPVTFVDHSSSITGKAKEQYPALHEVLTGDVTKIVSSLPAPNVVIACRISAFWDSFDYFERLANSLQSFPREHILIDFFDRTLVEPEQRLTFKSESGVGEWVILDFEEKIPDELSIYKTKLKVSYALCDHNFSYEGHRSFFRKEDLLNWCNSKFQNYNVVLGESLVEQDPSFSLKLVRKK